MMHKLGYGAWDELKAEIRNHWRFRFDWFFKSRTPQVCMTNWELRIGLGGAAGVAIAAGAAGPWAPRWEALQPGKPAAALRQCLFWHPGLS